MYGVAPPTEDEKRTITKAKEQVEDCAFILQAYIETIQGSSLANARDLKKIADTQRARVDIMKSIFKHYGVRALADAWEWHKHMMREDY